MRRLLVVTFLLCGTAWADPPKLKIDSRLEPVKKYVVRKDERAYQHALREAKILAAQHRAGHPLGCAPGARYSGTGYTYSARPRHCFYRKLSESRLIARAVVIGRGGAYFWSAHYR